VTLLLDTHVLVRFLEGAGRVGKRTRAILDRAATDELTVSAISFWEVAMLVEHRQLELAASTAEWRKQVLGYGITEIPVDGSIALRAASLVGLQPDPAERLIVATALEEGATLVTADQRTLEWQGRLARLDATE
jgi:PIN domain nuclease of toxin-antitoxin system